MSTSRDDFVIAINEKYGDKIDKMVYPNSYLTKFEALLSMSYSIIFIIIYYIRK